MLQANPSPIHVLRCWAMFSTGLTWWEISLTAREDLRLLDWCRVEDGASLEQLQGFGTGVGDCGLNFRVPNHLQLNVEW